MCRPARLRGVLDSGAWRWNRECMQRRKAKDELFAAFASAAKALGNGHRAEIVDVLAQGERSVDELAREIGQSVANTSQHLQILARTGLVASRRAGARIIYRLSSERVLDLWMAVRDVASENVAAVDVLAEAYLGDRSEVELIGIEELAARLSEGTVVLLDVRPGVEYRSGHLPTAISLPIGDLGERLAAFRPVRWSRIAAGPTASMPMTPYDSCRREGAPLASSMPVSRNGAARGSRLPCACDQGMQRRAVTSSPPTAQAMP